MKLPVLAICLCLFLVGVPSVGAQDLRLEVWTLTDTTPHLELGPRPLRGPQISTQLLQEAQSLVSAMVFGLRFQYEPADTSRGIADRFELTPVAQLPWGAPGFQVVSTTLQDGRLAAQIRYTVPPQLQRSRDAWASNVIPVSAGAGSSSVFAGQEGRAEALAAAAQDALRSYLRRRIARPREVTGEMLLWEPPRTRIVAGSYQTTVVMKLLIDEIRPHILF